MSHIVTIQTQVRDVAAIAAACLRLGLAAPYQGTAKLFAGQERSGQIVQLPGWRFPVVCDTTSGNVGYDNFEGHWGEQRELDRFLQAYALERAKLAARQQGYTCHEEPLTDGSIKLTIQVPGGVE